MEVIVAQRYAGLCDFCCVRPPVWRYPCRDFTMLPLPWGSKGDFAACEECSVMIEKDDRFGLAIQAPDVQKTPPGPTRMAVLRLVRQMHDKFFSNRTGPRERVSQWGPEAPDAPLVLVTRVVVPRPVGPPQRG